MMKQKISERAPSREQLYDNVFRAPPKSQQQDDPEMFYLTKKESRQQPAIYHIEKINKLKFKVYKDKNQTSLNSKLPITNLSFQIHSHHRTTPRLGNSFLSDRPRLEEILAEYKKMSFDGKKFDSFAGRRGVSVDIAKAGRQTAGKPWIKK